MPGPSVTSPSGTWRPWRCLRRWLLPACGGTSSTRSPLKMPDASRNTQLDAVRQGNRESRSKRTCAFVPSLCKTVSQRRRGRRAQRPRVNSTRHLLRCLMLPFPCSASVIVSCHRVCRERSGPKRRSPLPQPRSMATKVEMPQHSPTHARTGRRQRPGVSARLSESSCGSGYKVL